MKKDGILKFAISSILSPISPIITILVGGLISIIVNSMTRKVSDTLLSLVVVTLLCWLIITISYQIYMSHDRDLQNKIHMLESELLKKDNRIDIQERQIKNNISLIEGKYGEFSSYIQENKYRNILKKIVDSFSYVEAVYIHKYNVFIRDDNVIIKIMYKMGQQKENFNVNAIMQQYFYIQKDIYTSYRKICNDFYKLNLESTEHIEVFKNSCLNLIHTLLNDVTSENDITPENKRIISLTKDKLKKVDPETEIGDLKISEEIVRTGILGSILSNEDYLYDYEKNNDLKSNRSYVTFNDLIDREGASVTLVISTNTVRKIEQKQIVEDVTTYYYNLLEQIDGKGTIDNE